MELDLNITKDGHLIVFHDEDLERLCGKAFASKKPSDYEYEDLPKIMPEFEISDETLYRLRFDEDDKFTKLETLFAWAQPLRKLGFSIDAKEANEETASKLNDLVKKYKLERRVIWGSAFASDPHCLVTSKNESVTRFYSFWDVIQTYALWLCGCIFCCPLPGDFFQTLHMSRAQVKRTYKNSGCCLGCLVECMVAPILRCHSRLMRHLKARGNETIVWTVNERSEFDEMENEFRSNLTGIMTDYPTRLMDWAKGKDSIYWGHDRRA
jgi:lysophospholipase D